MKKGSIVQVSGPVVDVTFPAGELPGIREALQGGKDAVQAELIRDGQRSPITLKLPAMTEDERDIILAGCLINYYGQE